MEDEVKDEKKEEIICEWKKFKYNLLDLIKRLVGKKLTTQTTE